MANISLYPCYDSDKIAESYGKKLICKPQAASFKNVSGHGHSEKVLFNSAAQYGLSGLRNCTSELPNQSCSFHFLAK